MDIIIGSYKFRIEIIILIVLVFWILCVHLLCGCSNVTLAEGLQMLRQEKKKLIKENFASINTDNYVMDPSSWNRSNPLKQPIGHSTPAPHDGGDIFKGTEFKPECCPNSYSNSSGCACMSAAQNAYLQSRGANNI